LAKNLATETLQNVSEPSFYIYFRKMKNLLLTQSKLKSLLNFWIQKLNQRKKTVNRKMMMMFRKMILIA